MPTNTGAKALAATRVSAVRSAHPRPGWAWLLALAVLAGCRSERPAGPATFVILIDKSASVNETKTSAYVRYLRESVFPSLTPGARVVIEPIVGANTYGDPAERVVATLPKVTPLRKDAGYFLLKGDLSADKTCLARVTGELQAFNAGRDQFAAEALRVFRGKPVSNSTFLVDGMKEASEVLEPRKGPGVLVVLSDGLEDSDAFGPGTHFGDAAFWARNPPAQLAQRADPAKSVPGLKGAKVYFFGMAAGTGRVYDNVRRFWEAFFEAAGVDALAAGHQPIYDEPAYDPQPLDLCK